MMPLAAHDGAAAAYTMLYARSQQPRGDSDRRRNDCRFH
jgi:hypothetical protein